MTWLATVWANPLVRAWTGVILKFLVAVAIVWFAIHKFEQWKTELRADAVRLREAEISRASLELKLQRSEQALADERDRLTTLSRELEAARQESRTRVEVFNRHRFGELLQAKPGMLEARINRATADVWEEIEMESRQ